MLCTLSNLGKQDIDQIRSLENELEQTLLAFSCHEMDSAIIDADKITRIQQLEKKLGISLVAVKKG